MRSPRKAVFIIGLLALVLVCPAQTPREIKVIIDSASIRSRPELDAEILDIAAIGKVFEVIEKAGPWYSVRVGEDEAGKAIQGYIHESMVEPIGEILPEPPDQEKPRLAPQPPFVPPPPAPAIQPPTAPPREVNESQVKVRSREKYITGSFLKYGFNDHWVASFGYDYGIGRYVGIGLEFQPYAENLSEASSTTIQIDIFVNLKLGFKLSFLTLYGGSGIGPDLFYTSAKVEGQSSSQFKSRIAYHGIAGAAVGIGKIAIVFEYQPTWISDPDISPDKQRQIFFIGLRF